MIHSYEVRAAKAVGVHAAVLLHDMAYWCIHNMHNDRHFHDGMYWTYNTCKAFTERYEYMSKGMVERAIKKLVDNGYVVTGNFNKDQRDRTRWFAVTEAGYALDRNDECGEGNAANVDKPKAEKPKKVIKYADEIAEIIGYLNERTGRNYKSTTKSHAQNIRARLNEGYSIEDFRKVIDNKCSEWIGTDMAKYLQPSTLFSESHFDEYLNSSTTIKKVNKYGAYAGNM